MTAPVLPAHAVQRLAAFVIGDDWSSPPVRGTVEVAEAEDALAVLTGLSPLELRRLARQRNPAPTAR